MKPKLYVIKACPPDVHLFWKENRDGYTDSLAYAGLYSEDEAKSIENMKRGDMAIHIKEYSMDIRATYSAVRRKLETLRRYEKSLTKKVIDHDA